MQATLPTVNHPFTKLGDRLKHVLQEDIAWRECVWMERLQRVLGAIEQTFKRHQTIGDDSVLLSRDLTERETERLAQTQVFHKEVDATLDAFTLPSRIGVEPINWPFAVGLMEVPDLERLREHGEVVVAGLQSLGEELAEAVYDTAYTDLGGEH